MRALSGTDCFAGRDDLPTLPAAGFVLRPLTLADAEAIFAIFSDPEVTRYWGHSTLTRLEEAEDFIRQTESGFHSRKLLEWGLESGGDLIGTCAYAEWSTEHRHAEIGYALRRDRWGSGIMPSVLPAFIEFGFSEMNLNRIEADVDPRNLRSIKSLVRLGFVREGYLRQRYVINGEVQDAILYALLKREQRSHSSDLGPSE